MSVSHLNTGLLYFSNSTIDWFYPLSDTLIHTFNFRFQVWLIWETVDKSCWPCVVTYYDSEYDTWIPLALCVTKTQPQQRLDHWTNVFSSSGNVSWTLIPLVDRNYIILFTPRFKCLLWYFSPASNMQNFWQNCSSDLVVNVVDTGHFCAI